MLLNGQWLVDLDLGVADLSLEAQSVCVPPNECQNRWLRRGSRKLSFLAQNPLALACDPTGVVDEVRVQYGGRVASVATPSE